MKIGDLVELSSYGLNRVRAAWIDRCDVGIIVCIKEYGQHYPNDYKVEWVKTSWNPKLRWQNYERYNHRKDLKFVKTSPGSSAG